MEQPSPASKTPYGIIAGVVVVVVGTIAAFASGIFNSNPAPTPGTGGNTSTGGNTGNQQTGGSTQTGQTGQKYKDGTYTKTQTYTSPGGQEQFQVSVTLSNGTITKASFTPEPVSPIGRMLQTKFSTAFQQYVVGKNIDDVSVGVVSGASLTSNAFMNALQSIKAQAANS